MIELLTLEEAAAMLRMSPHTLRKVPSADLPRYAVGPGGGCLRYKAADIERYVESHRVGDVPSPPIRRRAHAGRSSEPAVGKHV